MAPPFLPSNNRTETKRDELSSFEFPGGAGGGDFDHAAGISLVLAGAFCQAVDEGNGIRPERPSQDRRDEKVRGACLHGFAGCEPGFRLCAGAIPALDASRRRADGGPDRLPCLAGIRGHRAAYGRAFHQAEHEVVCHQHRLPAGLLPGDGRDSGGLEIAAAGTMAAGPPVYGAKRRKKLSGFQRGRAGASATRSTSFSRMASNWAAAALSTGCEVSSAGPW